MLTLVARPDIVIDPFGESFPVEVSSDYLNRFFLVRSVRLPWSRDIPLQYPLRFLRSTG